jgi:hypothetical protein
MLCSCHEDKVHISPREHKKGKAMRQEEEGQNPHFGTVNFIMVNPRLCRGTHRV